MLAATVFVALSVLASCEERKDKVLAGQALKALRKVEASSQVNSSYSQYSQLVIDAKAEVNSAAAALPEGQLKKELSAAMTAYEDAGLAWRATSAAMLRRDKEPGLTLSQKYDLKLGDGVQRAKDEVDEAIARYNNPTYESAHRERVLGVIWSVAKAHLDRASSLCRRSRINVEI